MQYVVMDMEWNTAYSKKIGGFMNEIIEIGAVKLNEAWEELDSFSVIVKSQVGKRLQSRVKTLTHLTNEDIANGVLFQTAFKQFSDWVGTQENVFLTWGDGDIRTLIKNCTYFLEQETLPFVCNYADAQKYCQSFTDVAEANQQLGLSAAAEKLGIDPDAFPHHRALDDSRLTAACLRIVFDADKLQKYIARCDTEFYARLAFKPYYISDINNPAIDKRVFYCLCDVCGGKVRQEKKWKHANHTFRAIFYCKNCDRKFRVSIRFKQLYDRVHVHKTYSEVIEEVKAASSQNSEIANA